jgi:hypothetical protein
MLGSALPCSTNFVLSGITGARGATRQFGLPWDEALDHNHH